MKILFTSENYFPNVSGVPVVVRYLAEGLVKRGHNVSIATSAYNDSPAKEIIGGVEINRFDIYRDWKHCYNGDTRSYIDFVLTSDADVTIIECTECVTTDLLIPFIQDIRGKILFHSHGMSGFDNKVFDIKETLKHTLGSTINWFRSQIYFKYTFKKVFNYVDAFMCLSHVDSGIDYVKAHAKKWYILDNAADNIFYSDDIANGALTKYATLENNKYLMSCANYTVVKNQKEMIQQYYLSESSKEYSLICIGSRENDYYRECKKLVKECEAKYGHRDIHLLHGVNRSDIPSIVKGASLYLVSSRWEQYSISIIEAMSQGVPFISTNVGNARVLPGGKTIRSITDMHNSIDGLMNDKNIWMRYSEAGINFATNNCRIDAVVNKLEEIISTVSNGH